MGGGKLTILLLTALVAVIFSEIVQGDPLNKLPVQPPAIRFIRETVGDSSAQLLRFKRAPKEGGGLGGAVGSGVASGAASVGAGLLVNSLLGQGG